MNRRDGLKFWYHWSCLRGNVVAPARIRSTWYCTIKNPDQNVSPFTPGRISLSMMPPNELDMDQAKGRLAASSGGGFYRGILTWCIGPPV